MYLTEQFGNVKDLLEGSQYSEQFANGKFVHFYLSTYSYHRFHTPVSGKILESYSIHGRVYLDVNLRNGFYECPDDAEDGYEFRKGLTFPH